MDVPTQFSVATEIFLFSLVKRVLLSLTSSTTVVRGSSVNLLFLVALSLFCDRLPGVFQCLLIRLSPQSFPSLMDKKQDFDAWSEFALVTIPAFLV